MYKQFLPTYLDPSHNLDIRIILHKYSVTATKEISFFTALCAKNKYIFSYQEALRITELEHDPVLFQTIAKKFQDLQLLILRHNLIDGTLHPSYIRLCDEESLIFYVEYITEYILILKNTPHKPIPTLNLLAAQGFDIPEHHTHRLSKEHFLEIYNEFDDEDDDLEDEDIKDTTRESDETTTNNITNEQAIIYTLDISQKQLFVCTPNTLLLLCDLCISKLKPFFNIPAITVFLSKITNKSMDTLQKDLETTDYIVWQNLIQILNDKIEILYKTPSIAQNADIIDYIIILHYALEPHIIHIKKQEHLAASLDSFTINFLSYMKKYPHGVTESQYNEIIRKELLPLHLNTRQTRSTLLRFKKNHIITNNQTGSFINVDIRNILLHIEKTIIHSENLVNVIAGNFFHISDALKKIYTDKLYQYLIGTLPPNEIVFFDEHEYEISVHHNLKLIDALYAQILKSPLLLARVITSLNSTTSLSNKFNILSPTQRVALFFNLRTKKILPWYEIFNLQLLPLSTKAYQKLSFFRKLILRFTGRYKSMHTRLSRLQRISQEAEVFDNSNIAMSDKAYNTPKK